MSLINQLLWEFYAIGYDALTLSIPHQEMRQEVIKNIRFSSGNDVILDAGCGTGTLLIELSKKYPGNKYIGIDFSATMIFIATIKKGFTLRNNITLIRQSLSQPLPLKPGSVDSIITLNTLFALDSPAKTMAEFFSALQPHGQLIIVTPKPEYSYGAIAKKHFKKLFDSNNLPKIIWALLIQIILIPFYLIVFISNFFITLKEEKGGYTKYDLDKIRELLHTAQFHIDSVDQTMANQEWLLYATRK